MQTITKKKTNSLKITLDKVSKKGTQYRISISLDDQCKNGHADFAITGDMREAGKPKTDRFNLGGGAIGDKIAKAFPELAIFNKLHLCDRKGAPMHAAANGLYHLRQGDMSKERFCEYYRVSPEQFDILNTADDQDHFKYLLYSAGVVEQWQKEADQATALLEEMTGCEFVDESTRYQLEPLTFEKRIEIEKGIQSGYYSPESRQQRAEAKKLAEIEDLRAGFEKDLKAATDKAKTEFDVKILVLESGLSPKNFIFYNHTKTGTFNWLDYEKKVTQEDFNTFLDKVKDITPDGVKWELK